MCVPVMAAMAIASVAISAAQAVSQYQGQSAQAKATDAANAIQRQSIEQAYKNNMTQAVDQYGYKNDEAAQKLQQNAIASRASEATMSTAAGEAGVSGNSVMALQQEYDQKAASFKGDVDYNRLAEDNELQWQMKGFGTQEQSRINSLRPGVQPSLIGAGLQIAGAAANAYGTYSYRASTNPRTKMTGAGTE
jgi:hypothetical protein